MGSRVLDGLPSAEISNEIGAELSLALQVDVRVALGQRCRAETMLDALRSADATDVLIQKLSKYDGLLSEPFSGKGDNSGVEMVIPRAHLACLLYRRDELNQSTERL